MLSSRLYQADPDYEQMQALLVKARHSTSDWRYAHVGELAFNFFMIAIHLDPRQFIRLWYDSQELVGFAMLSEDPGVDWQILPAYEWTEVEEEALAWAETLLEDLRQQDPAKWGGALVAGARQDNPERIAFLERCGFSYRGDFAEVNMIRSLDLPIPKVQLPEGFEVRSFAGNGELNSRADAQRQVWQPWSVGEVRDEDYALLTRLPGYQRELDIVTVALDGAIVAYVNGWPDPINKIGDFGPVGALKAYRRQGLTRAALYECIRCMKTHGMDRVCISTGIANTPARNLYESLGFKVVNRYLDYSKQK